ncbi:hypothetical protein PVAND_004145 [Polypedilum vanderplanki]|uniref:Peptidase S1 domain-containing protein n=1 Tax=Polypedilum vanderplanki TaxID=319348 RepID=A0A9J6BW50_POLVA|nr:hypothetical protein PVAND_004145 [Polypedilum vanderplanki]
MTIILFFENTFTNEQVDGLGWGTIEFAGPKSNVLRKVELTVIDEFICSGYEICTTAKDRDTCQYDSGGSIIFKDQNNDLLYNIGIIRSGGDCATAESSQNIRVTAQLDWILSKTMSTIYCVK